MNAAQVIARGQVWIDAQGKAAFVCCLSDSEVEFRDGDFRPIQKEPLESFIAARRLDPERSAAEQARISRFEGRA